MDLKTRCFNFFLFFFLNHYLVNVVESTRPCRSTKTNILRKNTHVDKMVRKRVSILKSLGDKFIEEEHRKRIEQYKKDQKRLHHKLEMKRIFQGKHDFDYLYKNTFPLFYSTDESRYALLDQGYYATLYDTHYRVPVYSAYTLRLDRELNKDRYEPWHTNPGLFDWEQPGRYDFDGLLQQHGLHKGHLYPQFYAAENVDMKTYTNLLTNMALQYSKFNQNTWLRLEKHLHDAAIGHCSSTGSRLYFITGVIPSKNIKLNFIAHSNIPESFWTAACCDTSNANQRNKNTGWSFAYIVQNKLKRRLLVELYFIHDFLKTNHMRGRFLQLFANYEEVKGCLFNPLKSVDVIQAIKSKNEKDIFILNGELSKVSREYPRKVPLQRSKSV